jgi:hypothetical protein
VAELTVEPQLAGLTADHPAFQAAEAELLGDLSADSRLRPRERDRSGADGKGPGAELVVSVSASGVAVAMAQIVQAWLARDRRRSLRLSVREADGEKVITVEGDKISTENLTAAIEAVAKLGLPEA